MRDVGVAIICWWDNNARMMPHLLSLSQDVAYAPPAPHRPPLLLPQNHLLLPLHLLHHDPLPSTHLLPALALPPKPALPQIYPLRRLP